MDNFLKMLSTQAIMVVYMCIGYYCNRKDIIDRRTQTKMTDFVLGVTLPCMVFHSFNIRLTREVLMEASLCLGVAFLSAFSHGLWERSFTTNIRLRRRVSFSMQHW